MLGVLGPGDHERAPPPRRRRARGPCLERTVVGSVEPGLAHHQRPAVDRLELPVKGLAEEGIWSKFQRLGAGATRVEDAGLAIPKNR